MWYMMKVVVAPDSFKECLTASEVAEAVAGAMRERFREGLTEEDGKVLQKYGGEVEIVQMPVADGGEGTVEVMTMAMRGQIRKCTVTGPLGALREVRYGIVGGTEAGTVNGIVGGIEAGTVNCIVGGMEGNGNAVGAGRTAIIEIAEVCGLQLLKPEERNPMKTTTKGVGELLIEARNQGCSKFIIGLGGSATCDGGEGMMEVPSVREIMRGAEVTILCDVDNPFTGPNGAARVFAPQKGASPEEVELLEAKLQKIANNILKETGIDVTKIPGAGAAGGLGGAFMAYFKASTKRGIDAVLEALHFDGAIKDANLIITGEGKSDSQTLAGKAAYGVLKRSGNVPVALLSGRIENAEALKSAGFKTLIEVSPRDLPLNKAMAPETAKENLRNATYKLQF